MPKKRVSTVSPTETKAQKSVRLGNRRVVSAVKYLRLVGNLSGKGYEFTEEQRNRIVETILFAASDVERRFSGDASKGIGFDLAEPEPASE